jgi:hypothetical protein
MGVHILNCFDVNICWKNSIVSSVIINEKGGVGRTLNLTCYLWKVVVSSPPCRRISDRRSWEVVVVSHHVLVLVH